MDAVSPWFCTMQQMQRAERAGRVLVPRARLPEAIHTVRQQPRRVALVRGQQEDSSTSRAPFSFFALPTELRLSIYEFVFTPDPPRGRDAYFPLAGKTLEPLLTCRQLYVEARIIAFRYAVYNADWISDSICTHRLQCLEPDFLANLRNVAITTSPNRLYRDLLPIRYHFDHMRRPFLSLDSVIIVLQHPHSSLASDTGTSQVGTIRELDMVLTTIWYFKNVRKVCVLNMLFRERLQDHISELGKWTPRKEQTDPNHVLWRFELANFFDYSLWPSPSATRVTGSV